MQFSWRNIITTKMTKKFMFYKLLLVLCFEEIATVYRGPDSYGI